MIPNKRSVGTAFQLLFYKSYPRYQNLDKAEFVILGHLRRLQPKYAPSSLNMHLRSSMCQFWIHNPNIGMIEADLDVLQERPNK